MELRSWTWAAVLLAGMASAACDDDSADASGGATEGAGGAGATSGNTGSSATSSLATGGAGQTGAGGSGASGPGSGGSTGAGGGGGGGQLYFAMDCTLPFCGFAQNWNAQEGSLYQMSIVPAECPSGGGALRTAYIAGAPIVPQHFLGVANQGIGTPATQGMTLYGRWRARAQHLFASDDGPALGGKLIMIGDAAGHEGLSRVIVNLRDNGFTWGSTAYNIGRNIDAPDNGTGNLEVTNDAWVSGQFRVRTSSHTAPVATLTRSGALATATTTQAHGYASGEPVEIKNVEEWEDYEGVHTITVTDDTHFTFAVSASAPSPATPIQGLPIWSMSADASVAVWLDADNASEAAPTAASTSQFGLDVVDWDGGTTKVGGYLGMGGDTVWSPAPILDICDFQLGSAFDASWGSP
jgi:hypothetical protein